MNMVPDATSNGVFTRASAFPLKGPVNPNGTRMYHGQNSAVHNIPTTGKIHTQPVLRICPGAMYNLPSKQPRRRDVCRAARTGNPLCDPVSRSPAFPLFRLPFTLRSPQRRDTRQSGIELAAIHENLWQGPQRTWNIFPHGGDRLDWISTHTMSSDALTARMKPDLLLSILRSCVYHGPKGVRVLAAT